MKNFPSLPFPSLPILIIAMSTLLIASPLVAQNPLLQQMKCFNEAGQPELPAEGCADLPPFVPTASTPIKTVRIAFHIMQRADPNPNDGIDVPKENFDENNPVHVAYVQSIFNRLNELYTSCNVYWCDGGYMPQNYTNDSRIRFELAGTFYHRDDAGYINQDGTYGNSYCIDNYGICKDEVLNVFFCQIPDVTSGYGPSSHIMMFNQYSEYQQNTTGYWGAGNLLGHEVGHVLSLNHPWEFKYSDQCPAETGPNFCADPTFPTCANNMMSYARISDFISPMQMGAMHRSLTINSVSKYLVTEYTPSQNITITQPTIWDHSRVVMGDVTILPGATLTITCKTIMARNTRIIVQRGAKLIVDGATITTKGPTKTNCNGQSTFYRWTGIEVWGNSTNATAAMVNENYPLLSTDPGLVVLKNGARIEHAQVGVFAQQRGTPWAVQLQHFGGLISANNAEFLNCRKSVEYISHFALTIPSVFSNCRFKQTFQPVTPKNANTATTYEGVTSWQVSGLLFNNGCKFDNIQRGVVLGNATGTVLASEFTQVKFATEMGMIAPMADKQTYIGGVGNNGNKFVYCDYPVYATSYGFLQVYNNRMTDCYHGVNLQGTSIYNVSENQFIHSDRDGNSDLPVFVAGISLFQSGMASANNIRCNLYDAVGVDKFDDPFINEGIYVAGENGSTYWSANRFECELDVRLVNTTVNGVLAQGRLPNQGANGNPAFNEFSLYLTDPNNPATKTDHKADIHTPPPSGLNATLPFTYYPPTANCLSRLLPRCPVAGTCASACMGNIYNFTNISFVNETAPSCSFGPIDGILDPQDCRTRPCLDQYYATISSLDSLISITNNFDTKQQRLNVNNRKMALLHHLTDSLYRVGQTEQAAQLWAADPDRFSREALVGLRMQTRNYTAASQLLNNYPTTDPEDARFKFIESVYLDYLVNGSTFYLSIQDSTYLYEIAESYSMQSGYAQSLLKLLHGARFEPDYEAVDSGEARPVNLSEYADAQPELFSLYPNPAGNVLNIETYSLPKGDYKLLIRDSYGRTVEVHNMSNKQQINIAHYAPGIYWATLMLADSRSQTLRFVKSNN